MEHKRVIEGDEVPVGGPYTLIDGKPYGPLFLEGDGFSAVGTYDGAKFMVRKGERTARKPVHANPREFARYREPLLKSGVLVERDDHFELLKDLAFKSPTAASDFVLGAPSNGWTTWKDEQGRFMDDIYARAKKKWLRLPSLR